MPPPARNGWATRAGLAAGPSRAAAARPAATGGQRRREVRTLLGDCARAAAMWPSLLRRASLRHGRAGKEAGPAEPFSIRGHSAPVCAQRLETARLADLAPLYQPTPPTLSSLAPATGPHISHPSRLLSILSQLLFLPLLLQFPQFYTLPRSLFCSPISPGSFSSLCSFSLLQSPPTLFLLHNLLLALISLLLPLPVSAAALAPPPQCLGLEG